MSTQRVPSSVTVRPASASTPQAPGVSVSGVYMFVCLFVSIFHRERYLHNHNVITKAVHNYTLKRSFTFFIKRIYTKVFLKT